ncbi:30S ribosomal protein S14 [Wickerhamomyces ciferrii]|uniref:30S ribosomal protein S14 n=1 Tax=Wickerhamomyces ciferrii (strain ATCC 14091 / BCRC 22168 / CBS 111 / JCM 3599 / NBRC 0793 / NRRL Y-1031 F-60-10) TaxID=1206466 RepID=K0KLQ7_WICCF|nr:30S ribosomal protein S14 [Wickerhamomyces ciferrii]CCH42259.1 30S ribosomal protein S14 [Wickerhamomyces ciferrii]
MGNFRFPVKFKLPSSYINHMILRDHFKRLQFAEHEVTSKALKYIARNTQLPPRARLEAQLQLATMPNYTRYTQVRDRCVNSGTARSVLKKFRLNRVSFDPC